MAQFGDVRKFGGVPHKLMWAEKTKVAADKFAKKACNGMLQRGIRTRYKITRVVAPSGNKRMYGIWQATLSWAVSLESEGGHE